MTDAATTTDMPTETGSAGRTQKTPFFHRIMAIGHLRYWVIGAWGLALLTTVRIQGGRPEATECLCIAARLQRAMGTFIDKQGDVTLYFTLLP